MRLRLRLRTCVARAVPACFADAATHPSARFADNLKKTVIYTLAHLCPEILPIYLNLAHSFPLALNGLMILSIDLFTEQGPAISLSYERAEAPVMLRPPRDLHADRLVSTPSLVYSYLFAGGVSSVICMWTYFLVFKRAGIPVRQLAYSLDKGHFAYPPFTPGATPGEWFTSKGERVPPLLTADGHSYDAPAQWDLYCQAQAAWYLTLIMCQCWHIWNCRARSVSILTQGLLSNIVCIYAVVAELAIMAAVIYIPIFQKPDAFQTRQLNGFYWLPHFVYCGYIFTYNEGVKYCVRNHPQGWVARFLGW